MNSSEQGIIDARSGKIALLWRGLETALLRSGKFGKALAIRAEEVSR
jgi:hypothetical protein